MVFNLLSSLVAWLMTSSMISAVVLALAPADPAPALVFSLDWRNVVGWCAATFFAVFVYRALARKDRAIARSRPSPEA